MTGSDGNSMNPEMRIFETGVNSRNKRAVPTCPRCGSTSIKWIRFQMAKCFKCGETRARSAFKENTRRETFL